MRESPNEHRPQDLESRKKYMLQQLRCSQQRSDAVHAAFAAPYRRVGCRLEKLLFLHIVQQVFDETGIEVLEYGFAAFLRGVEVHIGHDAEIAVVLRIVENLMDMP